MCLFPRTHIKDGARTLQVLNHAIGPEGNPSLDQFRAIIDASLWSELSFVRLSDNGGGQQTGRPKSRSWARVGRGGGHYE